MASNNFLYFMQKKFKNEEQDMKNNLKKFYLLNNRKIFKSFIQ